MRKFLLCMLAGLLVLALTGPDARAQRRPVARHTMARPGPYVQYRRGPVTGYTTRSLASKRTQYTRTTRKVSGKKGHHKRKHRHRKKDWWRKHRNGQSSGGDGSGSDGGGSDGGGGGDDSGGGGGGDSPGNAGGNEESGLASGSPDDGGGTQVAENSDAEEQAPAPATLVVTLPAGARLLVDGSPTTSTGPRRVFSTPTLNPGRAFYYTLRAELVREGKPVRVEKRVVVRAGEETEVSLMPSAVARAGAERLGPVSAEGEEDDDGDD